MKLPTTTELKSIFSPNQAVSKSVMVTISVSWVVILIAVWYLAPSPILPSPTDTLIKYPQLWGGEVGLGAELWTSLTLNLEAAGIMIVCALLLSYMTVTPVCRPLATIVSVGRFNGFVGLPLILTLLFKNPHYVKVALMVFGMSVFTVPSVTKMIERIPKERLDLARTLRFSKWGVVWQVVVLGHFDEVIEILRTNIAMGWMMLPMVENLCKSEGGVGVLLANTNKYFSLEIVYGVSLTILLVGLFQDYIIGVVKNTACPFSDLDQEKR